MALITLLKEIKANRDLAKEHEKLAKWDADVLKGYLVEHDLKSVVEEDEGLYYRGTLVEVSRMGEIDVDKLSKLITRDEFDMLTSVILDKAKVERAINEGWLKPETISACTEITTSSHTRVTVSKTPPDDSEPEFS